MSARSCCLAAVAVVLAAAACGGDGGVAPVVAQVPGVHAVTGANQSDTVRALLGQALIVEVRGTNGVLAPGSIVRFASAGGLLVCRVDVGPCGATFAIDTADAKGQAKALVKLGSVAGTARVAVSVPTLGLVDTVSFTVRPGTPIKLSVPIHDTTLYVGAGLSVGGTLLDAYSNVVASAAPSYTIVGNGLTSDGVAAVRAASIGRGAVIARSGTMADTTWISVPPRGTIAAYDGGVSGIVKFELDGSGYRLVTSVSNTYYGIAPAWTAAGMLVFESGPIYNERLFVSDTLGNKQRLTPANTPTFGELYSAPARDGSIYFAASGGIDYGSGLYRSSAVGAMPTRIGPNPPGNANAWKASAAPDGKQLAYSDVNRGGLTVLDVSSGTIRVVVPQSEMPRWSPLGDWIAFSADSTLYRVRPDGTGRVRVGPDRWFEARTDWSPNGQWLIARGSRSLEIINVTTGEVLPLVWSRRLTRPTWRP